MQEMYRIVQCIHAYFNPAMVMVATSDIYRYATATGSNLVMFANDAQVCSSVRAEIYIDKVGYSRFDHANKAYDFGLVPPDSLTIKEKLAMSILSTPASASNDFIYCTTGAQPTDPDAAPAAKSIIPGYIIIQSTTTCMIRWSELTPIMTSQEEISGIRLLSTGGICACACRK